MGRERTAKPTASGRRHAGWLLPNIQDVFNEHGVQIMTPSYVADTPDPKVVPKEQWYAAPARPPTTGGGSKQGS